MRVRTLPAFHASPSDSSQCFCLPHSRSCRRWLIERHSNPSVWGRHLLSAMNQKYVHLKTAIESFGARFALVNPSASPIPVEAPLDLVVEELHQRLKKGMPLHPPREVIKGQQEFAGYEIVISEPMQ